MTVVGERLELESLLGASRDQLGEIFCTGSGIEIGAGARPTKVNADAKVRYADKRSDEELRKYFSSDDVINVESLDSLRDQKFDFVVAHHVLEHSASTIQTLIEWISMLRTDGVLFLSLPNRHETPDNLRLLTPPTHFVLDYVYGATEDDFESREHICSFLWSWIDVGGLQGTTKHEAANLVQQALNSPENDLHWHTFNVDTMKFVVDFTASLLGLNVEILYLEDGFKTHGEHRGVFRFKPGRETTPKIEELKSLRASLKSLIFSTTLDHMEGSATYALSKAHQGKLCLVENGKLRWMMSPDTLAERGLSNSDYTFLEIAGMEDEFCAPPISLPVIDRRQEIARRLAGLETEKGIELSPGSAPLIVKDKFNVCYLDKVDHLQGGTYLDGDPVALDGVLGSKLLDEVLEHNAYSYVVSSHVIEHVPDFIQFFITAEKVLKRGGKIVMYVPDRRFTFDVLRADSTVEDIHDAHVNRLRAPNRKMVEDVYRNSDFNADAEGLWNGTYKPKPSHTKEDAIRETTMADLDSTDVHCFTFTPESMRGLLAYVIESHVPGFRVLEVTETLYGANEFIVEMQLVNK